MVPKNSICPSLAKSRQDKPILAKCSQTLQSLAKFSQVWPNQNIMEKKKIMSLTMILLTYKIYGKNMEIIGENVFLSYLCKKCVRYLAGTDNQLIP